MLVTPQSSCCSTLRLFPVHTGKAIQITEMIEDLKENSSVGRSEWNPLSERDNPLYFLFPIHAHQISGEISNNSTMNYKLERVQGVQK